MIAFTSAACTTCGDFLKGVPCPDGRPGCLVVHLGCYRCRAREKEQRMQDEATAALQEANGLSAQVAGVTG